MHGNVTPTVEMAGMSDVIRSTPSLKLTLSKHGSMKPSIHQQPVQTLSSMSANSDCVICYDYLTLRARSHFQSLGNESASGLRILKAFPSPNRFVMIIRNPGTGFAIRHTSAVVTG